MSRLVNVAASLLAAAVLAGCLVPEKFKASITVKPDGSYAYKYDGTAVHFMAAAALKKQGSLTEKDETGLARDAEKAAQSPGVKKLKYAGKGRYELVIDQDLKEGQQSKVLKLFHYAKGNDGVYAITAAALKPKEREELRTLGIKVNGKAEVILPSNAKVVSHNATSTPGLLSKAYGWKIGSFDEQPSIRFTLSQ